MIIECPHCRITVRPDEDGICPACRKPLSGPPLGVVGGEPITLDAARREQAAIPAAAPGQVFQSLLHTMTPRLVVTPLLVLVNLGIFALLWQAEGREPRGETMIAWGANFAPLTVSGQWWRLLSSMFLHFTVIHVGFNMWVLWDVGRLVERLVGNTAFLIAYLTSGFFGSVVSVLWRQDAISAGASGAVFGVFGILLGFMLPRRDSIPIEVIRAHRSSVGAFLVLNLLLGLSIPWIDMAAHGGGLLAGFLCGLLLTHKVTPDQRGPRRLRTCLLALVALAACSATVWYLPAAVQAVRGGKPFPLDTNSVVQRFSAVEVPAIEQFNRLAQDLRSGSVTDEQAADMLEQQLLPPWREATGHVRDSISRVDAPQQAMIRQLVEYAGRRAESWELLAEGLRTGDPETIEKSQQASRQADELLQKLQ